MRGILISEKCVRNRLDSLNDSVRGINKQLEDPELSNKKKKKLMRGLSRIKGRYKECRTILSAISEEKKHHIVISGP